MLEFFCRKPNEVKTLLHNFSLPPNERVEQLENPNKYVYELYQLESL